MRHLAPILLALGFSAVLAGTAAPAAAAPYYQAEPARQPASDRLIVRELVWQCGAAGCVAGRSHSRAAVDCAALVRQAGPVKSFSVEGRPIPADQLEKCNARAH
ncbi:MAG TPA: hypothetical protein VGD66_07145 [Allosphingosinicella sp.]|jgi:hypothetical protein